MAGQQAENLLDFDADEPQTNGDNRDEGFLGSAPDRGGISSQAIASAAKSTNPLDELMDLFSTASMTAPTAPPAGIPQASMGGAAGLHDLMSPPSTSPVPARAPTMPQIQQTTGGKQQDEDLLGLF